MADAKPTKMTPPAEPKETKKESKDIIRKLGVHTLRTRVK